MAQAAAFLAGVGVLSLGGAACGLALLREGQGPAAEDDSDRHAPVSFLRLRVACSHHPPWLRFRERKRR